ncbi:3-oxoacyl-ACP synthase [Kitasatospora sp. NBC_01287]|uniref:3-oxoacyl-[acyl-carrier-protein] synthase III C-terminal domain-containing protein n=1 Tax=Kitasatospora sp. NBC_01287 TaxID=2903573 RepID=UPI0022589ECC|nr:3-oxoacyl-[acyl-carrier-protein] synthase III C-terminal domain-containing protein [Kitasatospora sp. NBC_01287]MCX4750459.1 3-oxoacyl-ACP synthase [Kitasatospora sp. NBC_01287]
MRLPRSTEPVEEVLLRAGRGAMERKMFAKVHGLRRSPVLAEDERMEDLLVEAGRAALDGGTAGLVLFGHTLLASELDRSDACLDGLRSRLGPAGARLYSLSHVNCASVLRSVELARRYLARPGADPRERVLVLGGDQGSSFQGLARVIPGVAVAGDAAVALLVHAATAEHRPRYRYLGGAVGRDSRFHRNLRMSRQEADLFNEVCFEETVRTVRRAVAAAGLTTDQVDWVMPHLSNRMFWGRVSRSSGIAKDRICLDLIPELGHNFGTDALLALEHADRAGRLRPGERCLLFAIGQGAYFQSIVVEVQEDS